MAFHRSRPSAGAEELLQTLEHLTDQVLERTKAQQARVELATALQRSMLSTHLPSLPWLRTAGRYSPSRDGLDIGGDWYDGFRLPDGTLAFAIGDVQGHGVEAATLMGQVRTGLRAISIAATDPGVILCQANELLLSMDSPLFVTCTFLRYDPASHELAAARAGHVPSVRSTAGGATVVLDPGGPPLGIVPGEFYPVTRHPLRGEGAFVLITDGVVEGPSFTVEAGLERVTELVGAGFDADADDLASAVLGVAELTDHNDDAAVLVLRHGGTSGGR